MIAEGFLKGLAGGIQQRKDDERRARELSVLEAMAARRGTDFVPGAYGGRGDIMGTMGYDIGSGAVGGDGRPGARSSGSGSSLIDLMDKHEGGGNYDTLFGHSQNGGRFDGMRISNMTLDQLYDFTNTSGEYGQWVKGRLGEMGHRPRVATPLGRGQIVGTTLRGVAKEMGLPGDTVFNKSTQDAMINHLIDRRLQGAGSMGAKIRGLRAEWEGFKHVSDADLASAIRQHESGVRTVRAEPEPEVVADASPPPVERSVLPTEPTNWKWARGQVI